MTVTGFTRSHLSVLTALCLAIAIVFLAACGGPQATSETGAQPNADPEIQVHSYIPWSVAPSLEEQIYNALNNDSRVVVWASLLSVTAGTEEVPGEGGTTTYRPMHELRFTVHEYLEGSGPTELLVVARGDEIFSLEHQALTVANYGASQRNTAWDDRQAALFVGLVQTASETSTGSDVSRSSATRRAAFSMPHDREQWWDYTVDTLSRAWLPAQAGASGAARSAVDPALITDGAQSPPPTIALTELRANIAAMKAELQAGEGIPGFEECISDRILRERVYRAEPSSPPIDQKALASGAAAGTMVYSGVNNHQEPKYNNYWLSGPNHGLFQALIVDDDESSANGYEHMLALARPLPAGSYRGHYNSQHYSAIPCNFKPTDAYSVHVVTVTAPTGTLHEAFFDPVDLTAGGVGATGSSGVIEPDEFTVSSDDYEIESLVWRSNSVVLTLDDHVSLSAQTLDFIELNGSIDTSLNVSDATVNRTAATWTWSVASAAWEDGDLLMLRIRETSTGPTVVTPTPTPAPTATPTPTPTPDSQQR